MRWLKRDRWKAAIVIAGLLLFLVLIVWIPVSANAYEGTSGVAIAEPVQAAPTVDVTATMTALNEEKLREEIQQLKNQNGNPNNWFMNNSTALIAATATVIVALFGIFQWAITARQAKDKELRAQAEERFKTAVTALGDENQATQVGGAILLRSFLNPEDREIYGRYYTQIFDLAVAYLRLPRKFHISEDPDGLSHSREDTNTPLALTPLSQALIVVFKEAFPLARNKLLKEQDTQFLPQSLDASDVQLDNAYLGLADLKQVEMLRASLRKAILQFANLSEATLSGSNLSESYLLQANLSEADLTDAILFSSNLNGANLSRAKLFFTNLNHASLDDVNLSEAALMDTNFSGASLIRANLWGVNLEDALNLTGTNLYGVKGLTKEQLVACKAKGAIIDEDTAASSSQSAVSSAQVNTPPSTDGSSSTSSQQNAEP